jgi:hypothetical protein
MNRVTFFLIITLTVPLSGFSQSIEDILAKPELYDNQTVAIEGEVIGEPLNEREGAWINVSSGGYALGAFFQQNDALAAIRNFGSYKKRGDRVQVEGTFYSFCPQHAQRGIHASRLVIVKEGGVYGDEVAEYKVYLSFVLGIICVLLSIVYFIKIKYARKD